jgi:SAM-dependent methyltransferase
MSEAASPAADDEAVRARTLARFEAHRRAWQNNAPLRLLYERWYGKVRAALPPRGRGPWIELGSGPGFAREFIPELELSDVVRAPWHAHRIEAEALPFADGAVGALVLFDVLHHLRAPARFFEEAVRVLAPGGRVVLCEPYLSLLSSPIYRHLHEEGADTRVDPLAPASADEKDPFEGNQAVPSLIFGRDRSAFERRFPALRIAAFERFAGPSYLASGGFSRRPLLPARLFAALVALEDRLPAAAYRLVGFRLFAVLERT